MSDTQVSKYLSYVLRHNPESIGIDMDDFGWVMISDLVELSDPKLGLTETKVKDVVNNSKKNRFRIDDSGKRIKANQGHTLAVSNDFMEIEPPPYLYHGTAKRNLSSILDVGILKMERHHVHMSEDAHMAEEVGRRYGKPVILKISSKKMHDVGVTFFKSANNVWLTDQVSPEFIEVENE
jgi:putative RNA 2'-phosphotransferase